MKRLAINRRKVASPNRDSDVIPQMLDHRSIVYLVGTLFFIVIAVAFLRYG